jgi:DNA polymerase I-like protein with 3'-5' exonuclease and polymerase domains
MGIYAADIETTGLLHHMKEQDNPHLHCMCFKNMVTGGVILFSNRIDELKERPEYIKPLAYLNDFLEKGHTLVMHNGIGFDKEALIYLNYPGIKNCPIIDTLGLSWYLEPRRLKHGLAEYGEEFGVIKPEVEEWENQPQEVYNHRVLEDTKIQYLLYRDQEKMLHKLYDGNKEDIARITDYINMKMRHMAIQQNNKWQLNIPKAEELQLQLEEKLNEQVSALSKTMPMVAQKVLKTFPAKPYKMDGTLSASGKKWYTLLLEEGMPFDTKELVVITGYKAPNPGSHTQVKDWLYSYGWVPETFKYDRDKVTGKERKMPQVTVPNSGGEIDPGIEKLIEKYPNIGFEHVKGVGILKHRIGMVSGFLSNHRNGFLEAGAQGFTNTLRFKHRNLVNLPSTRVPYGKEIRSLLIAGDFHKLLGSDLSSLEDKCKHHYQWKFDPEYVKMQQDPRFDPHLLMCEQAELLTHEQTEAHKDKKEDHSKVRHAGKSCNYAAQYGAGPPTIARAANVSLTIAEKLWKAYHDLNWSIDAIAESTETKKCIQNSWQRNPVNGFWYWLKSEKDRFSTLCQGTGSYICDSWVESCHIICNERYGTNAPVIGEFHDELVMRLKDNEKSRKVMENVVLEAMDKVNDMLKLNVTLTCAVSFGDNYAEIH